jgi:primase-polymerase (primpol)-like protein
MPRFPHRLSFPRELPPGKSLQSKPGCRIALWCGIESIVMNAKFPTNAFSAVPLQLREAPRWLIWKSVPNRNVSKKPRKIPFYVDGGCRGATDTADDLARLSNFQPALDCFLEGNYSGLGFALGPDGTGNYWQGIDFDNIAEHPGLAELVSTLPGYVERSPSGNGVHAIGYARHVTTQLL